MTEDERKEFFREGIEIPLVLKNGKLIPSKELEERMNKSDYLVKSSKDK